MEARVVDVYNPLFQDGMCDAIYMSNVISEIPEPVRAMQEFHRLLSPSGTLALSKLFTDPDYPLAQTLIRMATKANIRLEQILGNFFASVLVFEKARLT